MNTDRKTKPPEFDFTDPDYLTDDQSAAKALQRFHLAELIASYARTFLYVAAGFAVLILAVSASAAHASGLHTANPNAVNVAYTPNEAGGEIVLTRAQPARCEESLLAFSRASTGEYITGCWYYDGSDYVLIEWEGGSRRLFPLSAFRVFEGAE